MEMTLATALLRRKELAMKVALLQQIKATDMFYHIHGERIKVETGIDEFRNGKFPKLEVNQVTAEYDFYARQLRLLDAAVQQANWSCKIEIADSVDTDYVRQKE